MRYGLTERPCRNCGKLFRPRAVSEEMCAPITAPTRWFFKPIPHGLFRKRSASDWSSSTCRWSGVWHANSGTAVPERGWATW